MNEFIMDEVLFPRQSSLITYYNAVTVYINNTKIIIHFARSCRPYLRDESGDTEKAGGGLRKVRRIIHKSILS